MLFRVRIVSMERLLIGQFSPAGCSLVPSRFVAVRTLVTLWRNECDSHAPELECAQLLMALLRFRQDIGSMFQKMWI